MIVGTSHFVNFTKACDYYKGLLKVLSPAELEAEVRGKIADGEICIGKPALDVGERLLLVDEGCRYAVQSN